MEKELSKEDLVKKYCSELSSYVSQLIDNVLRNKYSVDKDFWAATCAICATLVDFNLATNCIDMNLNVGKEICDEIH